MVFVRGSVRPLDPRGVKVGGGMWASCAGRVREVEGEDSGSIGERRGGEKWVFELLAYVSGGVGWGGVGAL